MKKLLSAILALLIMVVSEANAQDISALPPDFSKISTRLDKISSRLGSGKADNKQISDYLQEVNDIQTGILQARSELSTELTAVQKKINALGEIPQNPKDEPAAIAKQRSKFNTEADKYKAGIAQADLIKTKIEEINALIVKTRNQELLNQIMVKQSSIFQPQEFWDSLTGFAGFAFELAKSPLSWYQNLSADKKEVVNSNILAVSLILLAALIGGIYLSRTVKRHFGYKRGIEFPTYSQKVWAAVGMLAGRGIIPAAFFGAFLLWLLNTKLIISSDFGILLKTIAVYLLYYYLSAAIVKVTFTPFNGKWRIIEVCDNKARKISSSLIFSIAAVCAVSFFQSLAKEMNYAPQMIYALKIFANGVKAFCIILVTRRFFYDTGTNCNTDDGKNAAAAVLQQSKAADGNTAEDEADPQLSTEAKAGMLVSLLMALAFGLSLFGYIRLSEFIINRFIISVLVAGGFYIAGKLLRGLFHQLLLFKFWQRTFRISRRTLVKTEFWFGLLLTPALALVCLLTLLAVWGVSVDIMLNNVKNFLVGFDIGGIRISITSILLGIICFFISLSLFKMLKNSFASGNLSKIDMDDGVRNSIMSLTGFVGFIFSGILAIAVMGGSLSSIAIIAGALSFGAGLGLQSIVSNLVAGLTILFERPIKVGDWVIIDGQEGIVKQINMRSTELETWSKSNIIIPNASILSKSVINMTYTDRLGRIEIKVGVDYNSDIELVKKTLLEIAQSNPKVLANPAPSVAFTDLADNSLNFQLNCFTANIYDKGSISNDLREKIIINFRELNINIPFPQQVIHLQPDEEQLSEISDKNKLLEKIRMT